MFDTPVELRGSEEAREKAKKMIEDLLDYNQPTLQCENADLLNIYIKSTFINYYYFSKFTLRILVWCDFCEYNARIIQFTFTQQKFLELQNLHAMSPNLWTTAMQMKMDVARKTPFYVSLNLNDFLFSIISDVSDKKDTSFDRPIVNWSQLKADSERKTREKFQGIFKFIFSPYYRSKFNNLNITCMKKIATLALKWKFCQTT